MSQTFDAYPVNEMISESELLSYIQREIGPWRRQTAEDPDLVKRVADSLERGLQRLNAVLAADPFWNGTNRRPTIFNLRDYFRRVVEAQPTDHDARWVLIALELFHCANRFGSELIAPMILADIREIRWLIAGAEWVWLNSGYETTGILSNSLWRVAEAAPDFRGELGRAAQDTDPYVARAAQFAACILDGGTVPSCRATYSAPRAQSPAPEGRKEFALEYAQAQATDNSRAQKMAEQFAIGVLIKNLEGTGQERVFVPPNSRLTAGRATDNPIVLDIWAGRHHCAFYSDDRDVYVEDLRSPSGTTVNGENLPGRRKLETGDVIAAGQTNLRFQRLDTTETNQHVPSINEDA